MGSSARAAVAVLLVAAVVAVAQQLPAGGGAEPGRLKLSAPVPLPPSPASILDTNVRPAQLGDPLPPPGVPGSVPDSPRATVPTGVTTTPVPVSAAPPEPPPPTVRLQLLTPAHVAPGKPIPYKLVVTNSSAATAYRVRVRMPAPDGASGLNKVEPKPDNLAEFKPPVQVPKEMEWSFKKLDRGEQKTIELEFLAQPSKPAVTAKAYVAFEHGQEVETKIEKPKLVVRKTASKEVARGEPATVQVEVTNAGQVPLHKVWLVEDVTSGYQFRGDTDSTRTDRTNQRKWDLGTLARGQSKIVRYQLVGDKQQGAELTTTSNAGSEDGGMAQPATSTTKVLVPDLGFSLIGPATVEPRKPAEFKATVRNNGTLPLTNVVVSIPIPAGCQPSRVTKDATRYADRVSWTVPRLPPGEAVEYRLSLTADSSGKRRVVATARDAAKLVDAQQEVQTVFLGRADLHWKPDVPAVLAVGKQGQISITVTNHGEEADKGVAPRVVLPAGLKVVQITPQNVTLAKDGEIIFNAVEIKPGKSEVFTVTIERTTDGQKRVLLRLDAQSLGDRPLMKEQTVE